MSAGSNGIVLQSATLVAWVSRVILVAYGILILSGYWSQLSDVGTTVRLVGSDVGCSLSIVDCSWFNFTADKIVGVAIMGFAAAAQIATGWRHRNKVQVAAAIFAIAHLVVLRALLNPS